MRVLIASDFTIRLENDLHDSSVSCSYSQQFTDGANPCSQ